MANTEKKLTKKDYYNAWLKDVEANPKKVYDGISSEDMSKFAKHELELLAKKNSADKKPTAQQLENRKIQEGILAEMKKGKLYTITEMMKELPTCADLTNQKISQLLKPLMEAGQIVRIEDKRKAYFRLAD